MRVFKILVVEGQVAGFDPCPPTPVLLCFAAASSTVQSICRSAASLSVSLYLDTGSCSLSLGSSPKISHSSSCSCSNLDENVLEVIVASFVAFWSACILAIFFNGRVTS